MQGRAKLSLSGNSTFFRARLGPQDVFVRAHSNEGYGPPAPVQQTPARFFFFSEHGSPFRSPEIPPAAKLAPLNWPAPPQLKPQDPAGTG